MKSPLYRGDSLSNIRTTLLETVGPLVAIAIGIVVVVLIAAMSIIGAQNSANLTSATVQIGQFMPLIGLGIGVAAFLTILAKI
jgi:amino acid transporter